MYDPELVKPMREELTKRGVRELLSADDVDSAVGEASGSLLIVVNSVCGCAAGGARPGIALALEHEKTPDQVATVFAGQDKEATEKARSYFLGYPPSSPSMGLLKEGKIVFMLQRHEIEGRTPEEIAGDLKNAFNTYC